MKLHYNKNRLFMFVLFLLLSLSLLSQQKIVDYHTQELSPEIPFESFVKIEVSISVGYSSMDTSGSGVLIGFDKYKNKSIILTVNHICTLPFETALQDEVGEYNKTMTVVSFNGRDHAAEIVFYEEEYDLCIVEADYFPGTPVPIADSPAEIGEKVYNVAAPTGFAGANMVPIFDGYYSGNMNFGRDVDSVYTVPVRGGSSGSPITNSRGEIIGIIHSALRDFENIGLSCSWEELNDFITRYEQKYAIDLSETQ